MGAVGEKLVKTLRRNIQSNLAWKINIRIISTTNKLSRFCGVKDSIPEDQQSNVIYSMKCRGCGKIYVGKWTSKAHRLISHFISTSASVAISTTSLDYTIFHDRKVEVMHLCIRTFTKRSSKMPKSSQDQMTG